MSGLLAGYAVWAVSSLGTPWAFGDEFLGTLFSTGVFGAILLGGVFGFTSYGNERQLGKALRRFAGAGAIGLAIPATAAVLYALTSDGMHLFSFMPALVRRLFWWFTLAAALGAARGFWIGETRAACIAILGLAPGVTMAGVSADLIFFGHGYYLIGSIFLGVATGFTMGLAVELLKENWLEEIDIGDAPLDFRRQFLLETDEFVATSEGDCDFSLPEDVGISFTISERDGMRILESLDGEPIQVGKALCRYRVLVDGDAIRIGNEAWIYHTRWARTRDVMPEAAV
ncbi:MAG: hypothetical protein HQM09_11810 [Candidatus Riflebacteria bacterium]|nr:hypothetical protein [Candidatus Riflebacteria bacterium]